MSEITFGQYVPGHSVLHRLDPRVKILASVVSIIVLMLLNNAKLLGLFGLIVFAVILISGVSFTAFVRSVRLIWVLLLVTLLTHLLLTPGHTLVNLGIFRITNEGLNQGLTMTVKLLLIVSVTSLVTLTTSPVRLTDGLLEIMRPLKRIGLPAEELALMMGISLRFIPTLLEELDKIKKAQMSRGALYESGNIVQRALNMTSLLVPILVSSFRRADELALAMESRGYRVGAERSKMKVLKLSALDVTVILAMLFILAGVILWRFRQVGW